MSQLLTESMPRHCRVPLIFAALRRLRAPGCSSRLEFAYNAGKFWDMKIKPLRPVFFAEAVHLEGVFPGPGMPAANAPTPQASIEDNSVHYAAGIELTVEKDASRQVTES